MSRKIIDIPDDFLSDALFAETEFKSNTGGNI